MILLYVTNVLGQDEPAQCTQMRNDLTIIQRMQFTTNVRNEGTLEAAQIAYNNALADLNIAESLYALKQNTINAFEKLRTINPEALNDLRSAFAVFQNEANRARAIQSIFGEEANIRALAEAASSRRSNRRREGVLTHVQQDLCRYAEVAAESNEERPTYPELWNLYLNNPNESNRANLEEIRPAIDSFCYDYLLSKKNNERSFNETNDLLVALSEDYKNQSGEVAYTARARVVRDNLNIFRASTTSDPMSMENFLEQDNITRLESLLGKSELTPAESNELLGLAQSLGNIQTVGTPDARLTSRLQALRSSLGTERLRDFQTSLKEAATKDIKLKLQELNTYLNNQAVSRGGAKQELVNELIACIAGDKNLDQVKACLSQKYDDWDNINPEDINAKREALKQAQAKIERISNNDTVSMWEDMKALTLARYMSTEGCSGQQIRELSLSSSTCTDTDLLNSSASFNRVLQFTHEGENILINYGEQRASEYLTRWRATDSDSARQRANMVQLMQPHCQGEDRGFSEFLCENILHNTQGVTESVGTRAQHVRVRTGGSFEDDLDIIDEEYDEADDADEIAPAERERRLRERRREREQARQDYREARSTFYSDQSGASAGWMAALPGIGQGVMAPLMGFFQAQSSNEQVYSSLTGARDSYFAQRDHEAWYEANFTPGGYYRPWYEDESRLYFTPAAYRAGLIMPPTYPLGSQNNTSPMYSMNGPSLFGQFDSTSPTNTNSSASPDVSFDFGS